MGLGQEIMRHHHGGRLGLTGPEKLQKVAGQPLARWEFTSLVHWTSLAHWASITCALTCFLAAGWGLLHMQLMSGLGWGVGWGGCSCPPYSVTPKCWRGWQVGQGQHLYTHTHTYV